MLPSFSEILSFTKALDEHELKPMITLVRYGVIPTLNDKTLLGKIPDTLFRKLFNPPDNSDDLTLTPTGQKIFTIIIRPLLSSSVISSVLARIPSTAYIENAIWASASKELSVMESMPRKPEIDWNHFFNPYKRLWKVTEECDPNPTMHQTIIRGLYRLRDNIEHSLIWPYSTTRGISLNSARQYEALFQYHQKPWMRDAKDFERPVSSRDVVSAFLHYGQWVSGDCEMKQRWYPAHLVPRTYFAQGGDAIRVSAYLRDFFNDVCDTFIPTNRYARVDASRLVTYRDGYFFIYDLTSFTSMFHEQKAFLKELGDFFHGVIVFQITTGLELSPADLGSLIHEYTSVINDNPRYQLNDRLFSLTGSSPVLIHNVAGFLGVPGNLATCTFPHGILLAQHTESTQNQSCAGDDGNIGCHDERQEARISKSIRRLGLFQTDKSSKTKNSEAASYLKRRFLQTGRTGSLIERVEYLILSVVHSMNTQDPRYPSLSKDKSKLRASVAASTCSMVRRLYQYTHGTYLDGEKEYILEFLQYVYKHVDLPQGGQLRGMFLDEADRNRIVHGAVVFPLKVDYLEDDPDLLFSEQFTPWVVEVPRTTSTTIFTYLGDWLTGDTRSCSSHPSLEQLVKYGWLDKRQVEKVTLVGPDARSYFRRLLRDEVTSLEYEFTALQDIPQRKLESLGIHSQQFVDFFRPQKRRRLHASGEYVDLDSVDQMNDHELPHRSAKDDKNIVDSIALETPALDY
jgi:hypothetical protein